MKRELALLPFIEKSGGGDIEGLVFDPPDQRCVDSGRQRYVVTSRALPLIAEGWLHLEGNHNRKDSRSLHSAVAAFSGKALHASHLIADRFGGLDIYPNLVPLHEK